MSVDVVGLRALAEKALDPVAWTDPVKYDWPDAESVGLWREADDLIAALRPTVVLALLDEVTTLRAEVADRGARIAEARHIIAVRGGTSGNVLNEVLDVLSVTAVPVPQDNPEAAWSCDHGCTGPSAVCLLDHQARIQPGHPIQATRSDIADEISGVQVGHGYESTTIGITAALEAADLIKAAFDVRPKNGEKP